MRAALEAKERELEGLVNAAVRRLYGLSGDFAAVRPRERGGLRSAAALALGPVLKRPPTEISREIAAELDLPRGMSAEAAGKGYVDFHLGAGFLFDRLDPAAAFVPPALPALEDPRFFAIYPTVRLCDVLSLRGTPPDGREDFSLLGLPEEERLVWAIAGGEINELREAALEFYDRVGLGGEPALAMARYALLAGALKKLTETESERNEK